MDYSIFIGKEVINKKGMSGVVVLFDKEYIIVKYEKEEKTYHVDVAFGSGFLSFKDRSLNDAIGANLKQREIAKSENKELTQKNHKIAVERKKKVTALYKKLNTKNEQLKFLFGDDFIYPPYVEFKKKYKYLINEDKWPYGGHDYIYY